MPLLDRINRPLEDLRVSVTDGRTGGKNRDIHDRNLSRMSRFYKDDPTRTLMRQVFGAIAQYEKTMIVMKLRGARNRKKAKTGRCEGRKPYGHYPGEKRVVGRMRALRAEGTATTSWPPS